MNQSIGDEAAISFSLGFYQALFAGCSIEKSYDLGCIQIGFTSYDEQSTPVLIKG